MLREFTLRPFSGAGLPDLSLGGTVARLGDRLSVRYNVVGRVEEIVVPAVSGRPGRGNGLWESTCFELFVAPVDADGYWEINVSPTGSWNVYAFDSYRRSMREEEAYGWLPIGVERTANGLSVSFDLDLARVLPTGLPLVAGVSAVVLLAGGKLSYWALCHPGPEPDFHRRDGFTLPL